MIIEKVILETTIKAGKTVWEKGAILDAPIPEDILFEIRNNTGTVKILKQGQNVTSPTKNTPALVQKAKLEDAVTTTTVAEKKKKPKLALKPKGKLKPKLVIKRKTK